MTPTGAEAEPQDRARQLARWVWIGAAVVGGFFVVRAVGGYLPAFAAWVKALGAWGPAVFIAGYAISVVAFLPAVVLTLSAGAIFGLWGTLYVFAGAMLGCVLAFLISRHFARAAIESRIQSDPRFAAIDRAVGAEGLKIVFLLRLSPVFPFVFLNYALGLTRVKLSHYALASAGMLPGTLLYVYLGKVAGDLATATAGTVQRGPEYYALLGVGLAATAAVTVVITRIARRALRQATGE